MKLLSKTFFNVKFKNNNKYCKWEIQIRKILESFSSFSLLPEKDKQSVENSLSLFSLFSDVERPALWLLLTEYILSYLWEWGVSYDNNIYMLSFSIQYIEL